MALIKSDKFGDVSLITSNRKSTSLIITKSCKIIIRAPYGFNEKNAHELLHKKETWLTENLNRIEELNKLNFHNRIELKPSDIRKLTAKARILFFDKVNYYSKIIGVNYNQISVKAQKSIWGSCNIKGNISLNCLLILFPDEVINYVIIHELCHRKYMNHSKDFWNEVQKYDVDYKKHRKWLKDNGSNYILPK